VPRYLNEADVLAFSSFMEGSPNVIKEAMACNCPIVSTDVGDVRWVLGDTKGCYIASFDPADFAKKMELAIHFSQVVGRTKGRQRIVALGLDMNTVAKRIMAVYKKSTKIQDPSSKHKPQNKKIKLQTNTPEKFQNPKSKIQT
jgi:glycosyltransferase involved in cell wall biosynthesis